MTRLVYLLVVVVLAGLGAAALGAKADLDERLREARQALTEERLTEAETLYRELVTRYPQQVAPYQGLAEVLAARGDRDAAVDLLLDLGRELVKVARGREAVRPLELAVRLDPEKAEAHALLGRVLGEARRYRDAATALERAVELGASDQATLLVLAASYWEAERYAAAERVYRRALELHEGASAPLYHFGQFLLWQGRAGEALAPLERAAAREGGDAAILFFLARARAESGDAEGAVAAYERVLVLEPEHRRARQALDLLRARRGRREAPPPALPGGADGDEEGDEDRHEKIVLTPVAARAGLRFRHDPGVTPARHLPETMGAGLAWLDYDGDGWQDLYLVQSGPFPPDGSAAAANRLFRNRTRTAGPSATFEDVTERAGAGERSYGQGATAADVDGDGDVDLFLTNYGPDVLLENRGDGTFADVTERAGLGVDGWSSSAAVADADGDGDLDLYVTGYVDYDPGHGTFCGDQATGEPDYCNVIFFPGADDVFLRQGDDGRFTEATLESGFTAPGGRGLGVVWTDLDGDRCPDVYVANDLDPNRLYRCRAGGVFEDVSLLSGAALGRDGKAEAGMGVAVGDVDGDGRGDLAVTNFDVETNALYRNLGDLAFDDVAAASGFGLPSYNLLGFGLVLADLDRDGDLDAFVTNGHVFERPNRDTVARAQRDLLLLGDGRGRFTEQRLAGPLGVGRGAAAADFDNDGDPDVVVQHNGAAPELWRNDTPAATSTGSGRWLGVELRGRPRNTQAVGARVTLASDRRRQVRWVLAGESYQSSGDRRLLFAWPAGEAPRELEVAWPSGRVSRLVHPPQGRYLRLTEP